MLTSPPQCPAVLLESFARSGFPRSFRFDGLKAVVIARTPAEVAPALREVEQAVERGRHAAGFVSYEAASGLNPDLPATGPGDLPLIWFGIFDERHEYVPGTEPAENGGCTISPPATAIGQAPYGDAIKTIRAAIARGETYQVNFTTRQRFGFSGTPFALYRRMCRNQLAPFCAWIDTGSHRILSASPELFFSLKNGLLTMRPMKGTAPRAALPAADLAERGRLAASPKERAENLMIVDLVRNDLSAIAETGSVAVPSLFDIETYPTIHQMTSTVTARPRPGVGLTDIFGSLFPCGSVTGAPKRRTMEIIRDLEQEPRGVYCGAIGYLSPGREATFSVAIRTVVLDMAAQTGELGLGSGITWDSEAGAEYRECLAKSDFLHREPPGFCLIETLRHDSDGYMLLERHLRRLKESAAYFGFRHDSDALRVRLSELGGKLSGVHKVRVLLAGGGELTLEAEPLAQPPCPSRPGTIAVSQARVDSSDAFLYHKTTRRERYEEERRRHPDCIDVVFLNERGEVTEGSYNNIVVALHGELLTPALSCGLLPGLLREELIEAGGIREAILTPADLKDADTLWLINSVRGWRECNIAPPD
jgi:para-aminobenzoate synthetase/4-amino-4-deoxychorismate lyase